MTADRYQTEATPSVIDARILTSPETVAVARVAPDCWSVTVSVVGVNPIVSWYPLAPSAVRIRTRLLPVVTEDDHAAIAPPATVPPGATEYRIDSPRVVVFRKSPDDSDSVGVITTVRVQPESPGRSRGSHVWPQVTCLLSVRWGS